MNYKIICSFILLLFCAPPCSGQNQPDVMSAGIPGTTTLTDLPAPFPAVNSYIYTRVFTPQTFVTDPATINENSPATGCRMNTTYYDAAGKKIQVVDRFAAAANTDIIYPVDNRSGNRHVDFLPYSSPGNGRFRMSPYLDQRAFYIQKYPEEEGTGYSLTEYGYGSNDNNRINTTYSPGKMTAGQKRGVTTTATLNILNEVIRWDFDFVNYLPLQAGYYAPGDLVKEVTFNADGAKTEDFKDREGHLICTKRYGGTIAAPVTQVTYIIYDDLGRIVFSMTPKATDAFVNYSAPPAVIANNLCNTMEYDAFGRVFKKHIAGEKGFEFIIYDRKGRAVLTQSPNQKVTNQWSFTQFDPLNRPKTSGLFTNSYNFSNSLIQDWFDNGSITSSSANNTGSILYYLINKDFEGKSPAGVTDGKILTENFYDNYAPAAIAGRTFNAGMFFGNLSTDPTAYDPSSALTSNVYGMLTGRRIKVLQPAGAALADWITEVNFYDTYGRLIQVQTQNAKGGWDYISTQFDYSGKILRAVNYHNNPASAKPYTTIVQSYSYAPVTFLLTSVRQKIDNNDWATLSTYSYDELGNVSVRNIGQVETQKLSYNIRGKLTGINKDYAENATRSAMISFGESLSYDHGFTSRKYDGNVSGIIWKGSFSMPQRAYGYTYDLTGRLLGADFNELNASGPISIPAWSKSVTDFSVSNISYDLNGNLLSMDTKGMLGGAPADIDQLSYAYTSGGNGNQLASVTDNVTASFPGTDFKDGNKSGDDYAYDDNGNLTKDENKHISVISYNHLDLPAEISYSSPAGAGIKYAYDAAGTKISETITLSAGSAPVITEYLGPYVYTNNELKYALHPEGKARYHDNSAGTKVWDYDYFIKDHLGNVRTVLTPEEVPGMEYLATHELASANVESSIFNGVTQVRKPKPLSSNPGDASAAELNGSIPEKRVGTSLLLKVMAGDQFEVSTEGYYEGYNPQADQPAAGESMLNSLITALSGGVTDLEGWEGSGGGQKIINSLFSPDNFTELYNEVLDKTTDVNRPRAYINYVLFDEEMHMVPEESGAVQIGGPDAWQIIGTAGRIAIGRNGYLAIFINNSSNLNAYFDNIKIRFYKGKLLDENHYYPYGLAINDGSASPLERKYLYQGNEFRNELDLNWCDFKARQYDPQIGRFLSIDPEGQFNSGYAGMGNNPVLFTDPNGRYALVDDLILMAIGGCFNLAMNAFDGNVTSFGQGVSYFAIGAVSAEVTIYAGPIAGGAAMGSLNSMVTSYDKTGKVDWQNVAVSGVTSAVYSGMGAGLGQYATPALSKIASPVLRGFVSNATGGFVGGFSIGAISSLMNTQNAGNALVEGVKGAATGALTAGFTGAITAIRAARLNNVNPWTGESTKLSTPDVVPQTLPAEPNPTMPEPPGPSAENVPETNYFAVDATGTEGGLNLFKFGKPTTTTTEGWKTGDRMLKMNDKGSPRLNWKQNARFLRREMPLGSPIFDSYRYSNGKQIQTGGFLKAERMLLENRGWIYNPSTGAYHGPR